MFTGIVEELGAVKTVTRGADSARLQVGATTVVSDVRLGDSISVNGVCLTVVEFTGSSFTAEVMAETLRSSNIGELKTGARVNLERAMSPSGRLGGHIVSGHIDGVGVIREVKREDIANVFTVEAPEEILRYTIRKGSVAVDGISLTVVDVGEDAFSISIIPHTMAQTTLGFKRPGDRVNIESDVIAKYVERLLKPRADEGGAKGGLDIGFLAEHGFL